MLKKVSRNQRYQKENLNTCLPGIQNTPGDKVTEHMLSYFSRENHKYTKSTKIFLSFVSLWFLSPYYSLIAGLTILFGLLQHKIIGKFQKVPCIAGQCIAIALL